jgi:glycosyltransferase involved in cell wall biosynthesis
VKIGVNALSQKAGGGITVARSLVRAIARELPDSEIALYVALDRFGEADFPGNVQLEHLPGLASLAPRTLWEQRELPRKLARERVDIVLALGGFPSFAATLPQICVWQNANIWTRVDVPLGRRARGYIRLQRWAQGFSMRKATANVFQTHDSLAEARTRWTLDESRTVVIHPGVDPDWGATSPESEARSGVLAVGDLYPHKNYENLIDAIDCYKARYGTGIELQIVGRSIEAGYARGLRERIASRGLGDHVHFTGSLERRDLERMYRRAAAYVTVSRLESFGLTLLEAMLSGTPVVAARASCLPEVGGDAPAYCDPEDPEDIAQVLHAVLTDEASREQLRERGYARAATFSWERTAREYLQLMERCLGSPLRF